MKILVGVDYYKPFWGSGGIARVCYEISTRLAKMGHDITVFSNGERSNFQLETELNRPIPVDGVTVYYFKNAFKLLVVKTNVDSLYLLPVVARKRLKEFDIVHIHTFRSVLAVPIWYYAKKYNVPYVLQAHGSVRDHSQKRFMKKIFDIMWGQRILKDASRVIASTPMEAEEYKTKGVSEDRIEVVPGGIDPTEFENLPQKGSFRKAYDLTDDCKMILYLGRIQRIKGLDLLVKAFAQLEGKLDNVKLVMVGPDEGYLPTLKRLINDLGIEEKVLFTSFIPAEMKIAAYVDADIYVLPSSYECFPTTVMEACACGTPVIVTDTCHIAPLVKDDVGIVVPYDEDQLSKALGNILDDDEMRAKFAERGIALIREQLNLQSYANRVEAVYKKVLSVHN